MEKMSMAEAIEKKSDMEKKQEASIPVQGRCDVIGLAQVLGYWEENGVRINTMSQLIGWSMSLFRDVLEKNEMFSEEILGIDTVAEATKFLVSRGVWQRGSYKRPIPQKVATAIRLEEMRLSGIVPELECPGQYKMLHNKRSVRPFEGFAPESGEYKMQHEEEINEAFKQLEEIRKKEIEEKWEEFEKMSKARDRLVEEKENAPVDEEFVKGLIVEEE